MDARTAVSAAPWQRTALPVVANLLRAIAQSMLAVLGVLALLVCFRRISGGLLEPLSQPSLLIAGSFLALAALGFRAAHSSAKGASDLSSRLLWGAPSAVVVLWAIGLSSSETPAGG